MLDPVETRLHDVQEEIGHLIPADAILAGQSLNGDLMALQVGSFVLQRLGKSSVFSQSGHPV